MVLVGVAAPARRSTPGAARRSISTTASGSNSHAAASDGPPPSPTTARWALPSWASSASMGPCRSGSGPRCRLAAVSVGHHHVVDRRARGVGQPDGVVAAADPEREAAGALLERSCCRWPGCSRRGSVNRWSARGGAASSGSSVSSQPETSAAAPPVFTSSTQSVPSQLTSLSTTAAPAAGARPRPLPKRDPRIGEPWQRARLANLGQVPAERASGQPYARYWVHTQYTPYEQMPSSASHASTPRPPESNIRLVAQKVRNASATEP